MAKLIHSMIRVRDLERSLNFYVDVLGLQEVHRLDSPLSPLSRAALAAQGYKPAAVKQFKRGDEQLARFFFIQDPHGYKIEMLERHGRCR